MEFERTQRKFESVYSERVRAGKRRTYFFDVRKTKGSDYYLTITESKKRFEGEGYERHKIFLYKEDFNRFMEGLQNTVNHVKETLMPDYDYDEYTRKNLEYEENKKALEKAEATTEVKASVDEIEETISDVVEETKEFDFNVDDDDLSW